MAVKFKIKLADIPIEVNCIYKATKRFCKDYRTSEPPEITVFINPEDIENEKEKNSHKKYRFQNSPFYKRYLETLVLCRKVTEKLVKRNVILFHGAVVAVNNEAYLFTARSGTGKTTHCKNWLKRISGSYILNGDKPLLLVKDNKVYACGSPWQGKENFGVNEILPLASVCFLERDTTNHIEETSLKENFGKMMEQSNIPDGTDNFTAVIKLLENFNGLTYYRLYCNIDVNSALVSYNKMVKK